MKNLTSYPIWLRLPALIAVLLQWQCSHYYYTPPLPNIATLKEKNDGMFSISGAIQEHSSGVAAQGAWSPVKHLALGADFTYVSGSDRDSEGEYFGSGNGNFFGFSAGAYKFYPTIKHPSWGWHLMATGGAGFGSVRNDYYDYDYLNNDQHIKTGESHLNFTQLYVQPSVAWTAPAFELIFSWRNVWMHYSKIDFTTYNGVEAGDRSLFEENHNQLLFEPAGTLRVGWPGFKFQFQVAQVNNAKVPVAEVNIGVGLLFYPGR